MKTTCSELSHYHFDLSVTLNNGDYPYYDPSVSRKISFSIPVDMFSAQNLTKMVQKMIEMLEGDFVKEVEAHQANENSAEEAK